jgi:cytochrome c
MHLKWLSALALVGALAVAAPIAAQPVAKGAPKAAAAPAPTGNATRGATVYRQRCGTCHAIAANRVGPMHRGIMGKKAGTVPGYVYSAQLKASNITWTVATMNTWLTNPRTMVPGTKMIYAMPVAQDRADVIAYMATQ